MCYAVFRILTKRWRYFVDNSPEPTGCRTVGDDFKGKTFSQKSGTLCVSIRLFKQDNMEAIEFKYKTNLHGPECIITITPYLDAVIGLKRWSVDMDDPDKTLTVHVADPGQTITVGLAIEKAGYAASLIEEPLESGTNPEWEEA